MGKIRNDVMSLRTEAEEQVACAPPAMTSPRSAEELLHELQVHQVELQMQNEELRRAQNAIEESRDRYLELYDFAPIGYLELNNNGTIDEINLTGAALLGAKRDKLVHRRFALLVASEYRDLWHQRFMRAKLHGGKYSFELALNRGEQSVFDARMDCLRLDTGVRVVLTDISEQIRLEKEALKLRAEMAELHTLHVAAQTAIAIAHELNQPLLAIATYSEAAIMLMNAENPDVGKIGRALNGCKRQALRAGQSIRELLDFLCTHKVESEVFDLNACVLDVLEVTKAEHELYFESVLRLEEGMPFVRSTRSHVKKVLINLLHNGIETMQEAGIPLPTITICTRSDGNVAQVTISDNGPGIRAEEAHRLFEPFFTTKPKGIGMGLAISRSLIEGNGGQLWVDPQESHGATFHFTLPLAT